MHPEFILHEPDSLPYKGTWKGHDGATKFLQAFSNVWENARLENLEIFDAGTQVIVLVTLKGKLRISGEEIEMPLAEFFKVRDGKVAEVLPFYWDTGKIFQALNKGKYSNLK